MAISLYDLSVANYLQTLGGVARFSREGARPLQCKRRRPPKTSSRRGFIPDMLPFRFQLQSVAHHSLGAIEGVKKGLFQPPPQAPTYDYRGLQKLDCRCSAGLETLTPAEVNALEGKDVAFQIRDFKMPFTAEEFLLSFSLPNFYFHATTAYDILRMKGVPLGKRDYLGQMRLKR